MSKEKFSFPRIFLTEEFIHFGVWILILFLFLFNLPKLNFNFGRIYILLSLFGVMYFYLKLMERWK